MLAACSGGGGGAPFEVPHPACPEFVHAEFRLWLQGDTAQFSGEYRDWGLASAAAPQGDCVKYYVDNDGDAPGPCGGACSRDETCYEGECVPAAVNLDVGPIHVEGTDPSFTSPPTPENLYGGPLVTYQPGDEITVSGGGADTGVEPFALSAPGVAPLTVPADPLTYTAGGDLVVTWDQADSPPGTGVVFYSASGGFSEVDVECWSDDTGQLTIPAEYAADVDLENITLLTRQTIGTAETELGCAMFTSFSRVDLSP